jgi:hypothetical protein
VSRKLIYIVTQKQVIYTVKILLGATNERFRNNTKNAIDEKSKKG